MILFVELLNVFFFFCLIRLVWRWDRVALIGEDKLSESPSGLRWLLMLIFMIFQFRIQTDFEEKRLWI